MLRRAKALVLLLAWLLPCAGAAIAQQAQEHEVKAAFLFKFPAFVEWPAERFAGPQAPFVIALVGAPEIARELQQLAQGRLVNGRPLVVLAPKGGEPVAGAHAIFVGSAEAARLAQIARNPANAGALLVSESPGGLAQGAMINFVVSDARVRFEVAPQAAERAQLRISSRLLAVALNVKAPGS